MCRYERIPERIPAQKRLLKSNFPQRGVTQTRKPGGKSVRKYGFSSFNYSGKTNYKHVEL